MSVMAKRRILSSAGNRIRVLQTVVGHFIYCLLRDHNIEAVIREICSKKIYVKLAQAEPVVVVTAMIDSVS